jgi:hypothetical protein
MLNALECGWGFCTKFWRYFMNQQSRHKIDVREVTDKKALKAFIKVPWEIYKDDPNWIAPLLFERKEAFSSKHPYFKHASWKAWVAYRQGHPVGRISAQIDELHQQLYGSNTGFFGLIESFEDPEVFKALFETAENWLRDQGMQKIAGPYNLSINQEIGILIDGFDTPPCVMTPHSRSYYGPAIEACGYRPAQELLAYFLDVDSYTLPEAMSLLINRCADRVHVRHLNRKEMEADFELMRSVFNDAWQNNWNFVPFTEDEFRAIGKEMLMVVPDDFIHIAEIDGETAAFIVLLPDINAAISDLNGRLFPFGWAKLLWRLKANLPKSSRVPLMGVLQKYQNTIYGPSMAYNLIEKSIKAGLARGLESVEMSWILRDNKGIRSIIERFNGKVSKRYHMYEKDLT